MGVPLGSHAETLHYPGRTLIGVAGVGYDTPNIDFAESKVDHGLPCLGRISLASMGRGDAVADEDLQGPMRSRRVLRGGDEQRADWGIEPSGPDQEQPDQFNGGLQNNGPPAKGRM